jgi:hypothetical protein
MSGEDIASQVSFENIRNGQTGLIASSEITEDILDVSKMCNATCIFHPLHDSHNWPDTTANTPIRDCFHPSITAKKKKSLIDIMICFPSEKKVNAQFSRPPSNQKGSISEGTPLCTSPLEIKCKWRQQQISTQSKYSNPIDSSWRTRQITCLWCGWLLKRASNIVGRWQERWFELHREAATDRAPALCPILRYISNSRDGGEVAKHLKLVNARREHDWEERACVSVAIAGRRGRVLLAAPSDLAAADLLAQIAAILRPPARV